MLRAAMHKLSASIKAICKVIESCSLAGSFRFAETHLEGLPQIQTTGFFACCDHLTEWLLQPGVLLLDGLI